MVVEEVGGANFHGFIFLWAREDEIFVNFKLGNHKINLPQSGPALQGCTVHVPAPKAVSCSAILQHGCPLEVSRRCLTIFDWIVIDFHLGAITQ